MASAPPPKLLKTLTKRSDPPPSPSPAFRRRRFSPAALSQNGSLHPRGFPGLRVAYQGAPGAYSEFAAKTAFPDCSPVPCRSFSEAAAAVERSAADRAVVPVESTLEGTAVRNYGLLLQRGLRIAGELNLFVNYCLLAMPGVREAQLRRVISHPMALAHCGRAIQRLGLGAHAVEDTAGAVEMLREQRITDTAAIASPRAAAIYGLHVLADGLQDESWNVTRFLVLSNPSAATPPCWSSGVKTSMVVAHHGGSMMVLLKVLSVFSSRNINLTKLEVNNPSFESQGPVMILDVGGTGCLRSFSHVLYVDFEGSTEDPKVKEAIDEIAGFSVLVRILGCYRADANIYDLH